MFSMLLLIDEIGAGNAHTNKMHFKVRQRRQLYLRSVQPGCGSSTTNRYIEKLDAPIFSSNFSVISADHAPAEDDASHAAGGNRPLTGRQARSARLRSARSVSQTGGRGSGAGHTGSAVAGSVGGEEFGV